jgi:phenylalanyl-tRNA synthetase beta chain
MKISLNWLRELVDAKLDGAEVAHRLTMAGLEVESRTPFASFEGVVVAEVRHRKAHPQSGKLTLVDIFDGHEVTQVVCGAPNVPDPGSHPLVAWARPGARLPNGITLAPKEVRGIVSPGMLCAEDELGLGASHEGIIVLSRHDGLRAGDDLAKKLGLPDDILEVNVTPNRPDCLGHVGVARELAAILGCRLKPIPAKVLQPELTGGRAHVELLDPQGCPRYTALVLDEVKVAPSPLAVRVRLQSLGVRAISNVVDATNLVLLESGQPLHAFDLDKLDKHTILVRRAQRDEKIVTLDGVERTLGPDDVAICDARTPVAVGGVMGGSTSEVSLTTVRVLLESAYFEPARIRRTARRLGLHTEASHRFERGVDPEGVLDAARRCAQLLQELAGARVVGHPVDLYPKPIPSLRVTLRPARTRALLGVDVSTDEQARILQSLGLGVERNGEALEVTVPTRRPDLTREVDLIEEVARLHGYDRVPATVPDLTAAPGPSGDEVGERARDALRGLGFDEVLTYAFVSPSTLALLEPKLPPLRLENPLREEQSAMRTTLWAGLLAALERNLARGQSEVRLFEIGEVFFPQQAHLPREERRVAGVLAGHGDGWLRPGAPLDLFDAKGAVEELLAALGHRADFEPSREPSLHPGVQARVLVGDRIAGHLGELNPELARKLGLEARPLLFELALDALTAAGRPVLEELPRFPSVTRDLSFFVAADKNAREIRKLFDQLRDVLCVEVRLLEDFRDPGKVPAGQKGMLWSFTYRAPDRTLTDAEVQALHASLLERLSKALPITPR